MNGGFSCCTQQWCQMAAETAEPLHSSSFQVVEKRKKKEVSQSVGPGAAESVLLIFTLDV